MKSIRSRLSESTIQLLMLAASVVPAAAQPSRYILIEHVGSQDKPIPAILIREVKTWEPPSPVRLILRFVVDKETYTSVEDIIRRVTIRTPKAKEYSKVGIPIGTFQITSFRDDVATGCTVLPDQSCYLFGELASLFRLQGSQGSPVTELGRIMQRIGCPGIHSKQGIPAEEEAIQTAHDAVRRRGHRSVRLHHENQARRQTVLRYSRPQSGWLCVWRPDCRVDRGRIKAVTGVKYYQ